uniref:Uncharacterized protein n=1 Tax=Anguilla anguilla TaxID=7936 RepID=A0A0E9W9R3_ANGAN
MFDYKTVSAQSNIIIRMGNRLITDKQCYKCYGSFQ